MAQLTGRMLAVAMAAALSTGVREAGRRRATAARSLRDAGRPAGRAGVSGSGRADPGIPGRRDPRAGRRLPRHGELPRRVVRSQGRPALSDRPEAAPGHARAGERRTGDGPGAAREGQQRRRALHAARRQAGRQPAGARRRARRAGRDAVAGRGGQGGGGEGDARSRLRADHVADQRAGRHDAGEAGQPRRARREHAADDRSRRSIRSSSASAVTEADYLRIIKRDPTRAGQEAQGVRHPADAGRRHHVSAHGHDRAGRARRQQRHRHARRAARTSPTPTTCCGRASTGGRGCCSTPRPARSWFRSAPCRSCRTCTASPSSAPTTRSRSAT